MPLQLFILVLSHKVLTLDSQRPKPHSFQIPLLPENPRGSNARWRILLHEAIQQGTGAENLWSAGAGGADWYVIDARHYHYEVYRQ